MRDGFADRIAHWIAVVFGLGYVPAAPGTAGSLGGACAFILFFGAATSAEWAGSLGRLGRTGAIPLGPFTFGVLFMAVLALLFVLGTWAAFRVEARFGRHDDGRIVIDEVLGQWVALIPLPIALGLFPTFSELILGVVTAFVLFRLFDVWKPGAVGWAERRFKGGLGVMADDVVAGFFAAGVWVVLAQSFPLFSPLFASLSTGPLSIASLTIATLTGGVPA